MTIQVNTLKINASVSDSGQVNKTAAEIKKAPAGAGGQAADQDELVEKCVERVLDVLRRELKP
ncbi:MAG: hypothetical protein FD123_861 [Bacteroidetes bacterium]|nr:MAG: hypothetical protein FD123_861 [Bacteroidota bacterium]